MTAHSYIKFVTQLTRGVLDSSWKLSKEGRLKGFQFNEKYPRSQVAWLFLETFFPEGTALRAREFF